MTYSGKKKFLIIFKLILMSLLLIIIGHQVHWHDYYIMAPDGSQQIRQGIASIFGSFSFLPLIIAFCFQLGTIILIAYRWHLLLLSQHIGIKRKNVVRLTFLGEFFNQFFLGILGGDLVKAFYLIKHGGRKSLVLVSIFVDRFVSLIILTLLALIMLPLALFTGLAGGSQLQLPTLIILATASAIIIVMVLSLNKRFYELPILRRVIAKMPLSRHIEEARTAIHQYRHLGKIFFPIFICGGLSVFLNILSVFFIGTSLEASIDWPKYFLYLPLVFIMAAAPLTPGSIGILEELFLYFFGTFEEPNRILAIVLLYRLILILCTIPGSFFFFFGPRISRKEMAQEIEKIEDEDGGQQKQED